MIPGTVSTPLKPHQKRNYPLKTFTLSPQAIAALAEISEETGESKSNIVDRMVLRAHAEWQAARARRAREAGDDP